MICAQCGEIWVEEKGFQSFSQTLKQVKAAYKSRLVPASRNLVDQRLAEGLEDLRKGRTYGPFDTAKEMITSLKAGIKKLHTRRKPRVTMAISQGTEKIKVGRYEP